MAYKPNPGHGHTGKRMCSEGKAKTFKRSKKEDGGNYKMISIISWENYRAKLHTVYFQAPKGQDDHHMVLRRGWKNWDGLLGLWRT